MTNYLEQQPKYPCSLALANVLNKLKQAPGLVTPDAIDTLSHQLALITKGKGFVLHAGDCAEDLHYWSESYVTKSIDLIQRIQLLLEHQLDLPVVPIGRIAGQYFKPRSHLTETKNQITLPSYQGDGINRIGFSLKERTPDPELLIKAYQTSEKTLKLVKNLYTSHEALHLDYENCFTRNHYNVGAHLLWTGIRTNSINGPHVEYLKRIRNPIAIKIGPNTTPEDAAQLAHYLNPNKIPGRLTLIHRFGFRKIEALLPPIISAIHKTNIPVLWSCDPMHGNTELTHQGIKTRNPVNIISEIKQAFWLHELHNSQLNGLHLELTGTEVTECSDTNASLDKYQSLMDPRLNPEQAITVINETCLSD